MLERGEITVLKWIVTAGIICAFLVANIFTPMMSEPGDDAWVFFITLGICIGQINLIATWAALAPGNIMLRLPWSLLLAVLMWYSLVLGNRIEHRSFDLDEAVTLGVTLLFAVVVAQIPLWIAGRVFRWRLVSWAADAKQSASTDLQFQLRHVLLGMVFLSLALAPARVVLPAGDVERVHLEDELWLLLPAAAICNLLITVPCIWGAFLDVPRLVPLAFGWLAYCGVLSAMELGTLIFFLGQPGVDDAFFLTFLLNISQCATVIGTLLIFRALGFRLLRERRSRSVPDAEPSDANGVASPPPQD